jgi:hypothetical protein
MSKIPAPSDAFFYYMALRSLVPRGKPFSICDYVINPNAIVFPKRSRSFLLEKK